MAGVFVVSVNDPPLGRSMRVAWNNYDDSAGLRGYDRQGTKGLQVTT